MESNENKTIEKTILENMSIQEPETSKDFLALAKALSEFQAKCPSINKNAKGYGYNYADLSNIITTIQPILTECKLILLQPVFGNGKEIGVKTIVMHHPSGEYISSSITTEMAKNTFAKMTPVQCVGTIISYFRRYSLPIIGIVSDEDTDGADPSKKQPAKPNKQTPPAKPAKPKTEWLTDENFKKALELDESKLSLIIKKYSSEQYKMKAAQKKSLTARLEELKKAKNE